MSKSAFTKDPRRGDDRNLVIVDQDFGEPDLEDRIWLFWVRNKGAILGVAAALIVGTLGYIGWHAASSFSLQSMQTEFQGIGNKPEDKLLFARSYQGHALAGVAALDAGDALLKEKKFNEAASAYSLAQTNFPVADPFLAANAARALLGEAFAKIGAGDAEAGAVVLTTLANGKSYPSADRGQAMYSLALMALEKKDIAGARKWIDAMDRDIDPMNPWLPKKQELILLEPALMDSTALGIQSDKADAPVPSSTPAPVQ